MALLGGRSQHLLEALGERVTQLEARCQSLSDQLAERDAEVNRLRSDCTVLSKRLDLTAEQSLKASTGLLEQLRAMRGELTASTGTPETAVSRA